MPEEPGYKTNLIRRKVLFVLLPMTFNAISRFGTITGFLLSSLVGIVFVDGLLRKKVPEPVSVLF